MNRDLQLAGAAPGIFDSVCGLATATNVVLKRPEKHRDAARIEAAKEVGQRFTALVYALVPATLEYRPDMPEAELRAWAARVMEAIK